MTQKTQNRWAGRRLWLLPALAALLLLAACGREEAAAAPTPAPTETPAPTAVPAPKEIELGGRAWRREAEVLVLPADTPLSALETALGEFDGLSTVTFVDGAVPWETQDALRRAFPDITFYWSTELLGRVFSARTERVSFAGEALTEADLKELEENAFRLSRLRSVDLTGCEIDNETLHALDAALGEIDVIWSFTVYGAEVRSTDEELDLSHIAVYDRGAELETALGWFSHLKKVDMSYCGMSNEELDALNRRHEDVRIVWTVFFSIFSVRTDETNFIAARTYNKAPVYSNDCAVLRYCTDMIALDLGHKDLTDLSFLYDMPQLQYLILVENNIRDITPIGSLKELKYLEIFWTKVEDLSPLINCTELEDLNICYIYSRPDPAFAVLMQMPWLERLWYCGNALKDEQVQALRENMPQCEMYLEPRGESTGGTWREHPHYYAMRDVFGMYYMPGGTNGVAADGSQIIING